MTDLAIAASPAHVPPAFNADFYVATVTVIPVLFLALAVQGPVYRKALRGTWRLTLYTSPTWPSIFVKFLDNLPRNNDGLRAAGRILIMIWAAMITIAVFILVLARCIFAFALALVLTFGIAIIAAGGYGELLGVYALYQAQGQHTTRIIVLLATMLLVVLVAAGPLVTYVLSAFSTETKPSPSKKTEQSGDQEIIGERNTPPEAGDIGAGSGRVQQSTKSLES